MKTTRLLTALVLFAAACLVRAGDDQRLTGVFSNFEYNEEGGDLLGWEVIIVLGGDRHYAIVQCAEGSPSRPEVVALAVSGSKISFTLEDGSTFSGVIGKRGIKGAFKHRLGGAEDVVLKRGKSYWQ